MGKLTLSKLQRQQYSEIKEAFEAGKRIGFPDEEQVRLGDVLTLLETTGYIRKLDIDNTNAYERIGNFKDFEAWHKDRIREERKLSRREWKIAIVSAVIGAVIGLVPTIISVIKDYFLSGS